MLSVEDGHDEAVVELQFLQLSLNSLAPFWYQHGLRKRLGNVRIFASKSTVFA